MVVFLIWVATALAPAAPPPAQLLDRLGDRLRARLETATAQPTALDVDGHPLHAPAVVSRFYSERIYRPAWTNGEGRCPLVRELIDAVRSADRHGLEPSDYHLATLSALTAAADSDSMPGGAAVKLDQVADLELAATDAFLVYGSHLLAGRVDPARLEPDWRATPGEADPVRILEQAIAAGAAGGIGEALAALAPAAPGYRRLEDALAHYRELAARGGWRALPPGSKLDLGASGERVRLLRRRLAASGDLDDDALVDRDAASVFDDALDRAVRAFQARHGLEIDGVVGRATLAALDVPASERAVQIWCNLERWRWLPRDLGSRYLLVNVPAFELRVMERDQAVMSMRAVVGKPYRKTPIFSATMTYLVVSPYWQVPPGIAVRDILPAVKKDPAYLAERGFRVFQGWGATEREIDPAAIDWKSLSPRGFPYRFRQEPSDKNMLGRIKFMFPNPYNVYLHDTPLRELFLPARRDFSSGCIRIEAPFELAFYLLRDDPRWTHEALLAAATIDAETTIALDDRVPVHVLYWTAWADDGAIQFRDDIYGRDAALAAALGARPSTRTRD